MSGMFLRLRRGAGPALFTLAYCGVILAVVIGYILWDRRYRRAWQQFRARNWQAGAGQFDKGEIVTMRNRSRAITGNQVWLGYAVDGGGTGPYTLAFSCEFPNAEEAG